jgi:hypothetical protein
MLPPSQRQIKIILVGCVGGLDRRRIVDCGVARGREGGGLRIAGCGRGSTLPHASRCRFHPHCPFRLVSVNVYCKIRQSYGKTKKDKKKHTCALYFLNRARLCVIVCRLFLTKFYSSYCSISTRMDVWRLRGQLGGSQALQMSQHYGRTTARR